MSPPRRVTGTTREGGAPFPCIAGLLGKLVSCYERKICGRTCTPGPSTSSLYSLVLILVALGVSYCRCVVAVG